MGRSLHATSSPDTSIQTWRESELREAAFTDPLTKPFLKWVGGKRGLLDQLEPLLPIRFGGYIEPFVGGGAVYFALRPERAILSDVNQHLVTLYETVRNHPTGLMRDLNKLAAKHDDQHFYEVREAFNEEPKARPILRAARFLYLNKTCFNGLFRMNRKGYFNVPVGRYSDPTICDKATLCEASTALQNAEVRHASFEDAIDWVEPGDFVYMDPPYVPLNATSSFTSYAKSGFGPKEQLKLRDVFAALDARGAQVMLSNSDAPEVLDLYQGFRVDRVWARRSVNSRADRRGPVSEVVVRNFYLDRAGAQRVQERMASFQSATPSRVHRIANLRSS